MEKSYEKENSIFYLVNDKDQLVELKSKIKEAVMKIYCLEENELSENEKGISWNITDEEKHEVSVYFGKYYYDYRIIVITERKEDLLNISEWIMELIYGSWGTNVRNVC